MATIARHDAHGDQAEAGATQRAMQHEEAGEATEAETWRAVRKAIQEIREACESQAAHA